MANEKIHEYIDSVLPDEPKGTQIWIDTDTGSNQNGWLSKKLEMAVLGQILRTNFRVHGQFGSNQKQAITTINTPQQITLNLILNPSQIGMVNNEIIFNESGLYRVQYILNVSNSGGQHQHLQTWMVLDRQNVDFSRRIIDAHSNQIGSPLVNEMFVDCNENSVLSFWMMATDRNVEITSDVATSIVPDMMSISITIDKV